MSENPYAFDLTDRTEAAPGVFEADLQGCNKPLYSLRAVFVAILFGTAIAVPFHLSLRAMDGMNEIIRDYFQYLTEELAHAGIADQFTVQLCDVRFVPIAVFHLAQMQRR